MPDIERETIQLVDFRTQMDGQIITALSPSTSTQKSVEAANYMLNRLAAVEAGDLVVQPPLQPEVTNLYQDKAQTIKSIGDNALAGIRLAEQARADAVQEAHQARQQLKTRDHRRSFRGRGTLAKS